MTDPTPEPDPTHDPTPDPTPDPPAPDDLAAEVEKWKHFARQHEKTAKANADAAAELQALKDAAKTEAERTADALTAAQREAADARLELTRMKVASRDPRLLEVADLITGSTEEEMTAAAERLLSVMKPATPPTPTGSADGGPQGAPKVGQLSRDALKTMTPEQILEAKAAGQLDDVLGITTP